MKNGSDNNRHACVGRFLLGRLIVVFLLGIAFRSPALAVVNTLTSASGSHWTVTILWKPTPYRWEGTFTDRLENSGTNLGLYYQLNTTGAAFNWGLPFGVVNSTIGNATQNFIPPNDGTQYYLACANTINDGAGVSSYFVVPMAASGPTEYTRVVGTNESGMDMRRILKDKDGNTLWDSGTIKSKDGSNPLQDGKYDSGSIDVTGKTPAKVETYYRASYGDNIWQEDTGATSPVSTTVPDPKPVTAPTSPTPPPSTTPPIPPQAPVPNPAANTIKNTYVSSWPTSTSATTDNERLDKTTYKQGVDKLDTTAKQIADGTLKEVKEKSDKFKSDTEAQIAAEETLAQGRTDQFKDAMKLGAKSTNLGTSLTVPTGVAGAMNYAIGSAGAFSSSWHIDLNPFTNASVPSWVKSLLFLAKALWAWWMIVWCFLDVSEKVRNTIIATMAVQKPGSTAAANASTAIPVAGALISTGLQVVSYALWIAVAILIPAAVAALMDTFDILDYNSYFSTVNSLLNQGGTMGTLIRLAFSVVPFGTLCLVITTRVACSLMLTASPMALAVYTRMSKI